MKKLHLLFFYLLFFAKSFAQSPASITIKDDFYNNVPLDRIFDELQQKYHFRMVYDADLLKKYKLTYWFTDIKLENALKVALKDFSTELRYFIDENNIVHILPRTEKVDPAKINKTFVLDAKDRGQPQKFNFTLTGKVIDQANGEPLPFATVMLKSNKLGVLTNVDGYFTLSKVPSDTVALVLNYIGYKNQVFYLSQSMSKTNLVIEMEAANLELDEIEVSAQRTEVMKANEVVGMFKMTPKNIAKLPNIGERDIFRAFQLMPGVSAANESSSGLFVRGGTPDQTLILYDGFTVYHVDHLYGFFSAFNYNAIKDVQLYKGGFESKFGGRISGVAEITGKEGNKKEINTGVDVSLLSANAFLEGPIGKKTTILFAGRRSWQGPLYTKIFNQLNASSTSAAQAGPGGGRGGFGRQAATTTPTSYFYDLNGKVTFKPTDNDVISLSVYDGTDKLDNSQNVNITNIFRQNGGGGGGAFNNTDLSNWGNTGASIKWSRRWNREFYSNFLLSYSNYFSRRDNTTETTFTPPNGGDTRTNKFGSLEDNNLQDKSFKADFEWKPSEQNRIQFGANLSNLSINYTYAQNDTLTILEKKDQGNTLAFYVQDQITAIDERLVIKPGIRMTYFTPNSKAYFEPRFSATYQLNNQLKLKSAGGLYYQFAKQVNREDFSTGNRNFWLLANNDYLPVSAALHLILGASYETKGYLFDVEAYYKDLSNVTEYTLRFTPQVRRGLTAQETFYNGTGYVQGVDFLVQKKFGKFSGWVGYTIAQAKTNIAQFSNQAFFANQDVRHEFKSVNSYKLGPVDLALTYILATGKPYTSIVGGYSVKLLDGTTKEFTDPSDKNANRLPTYHRMDVSATYNTKHTSIALSVFNVYNHQNVWYKKFNVITDNGVKNLLVTDVTYLGLTPNLTFSWKLR